MDARRFHGNHSVQKSRRDVKPYTIVMEIDQPEAAKGVKTTYTSDPVETEAWLRNNVIDVNEIALGFDMEWKPQFVKKKLGGKENKTAVLQLSTETSCLVLHLIHVKTFPRCLVDIIGNQDIVKVGCGIKHDIIKLFKDTGLRCKGAVDLAQLASKTGYEGKRLGMKALSENLLGIEMVKPKKVQMSNWERLPLQTNQIHYAALDAWIGIKLYLHMKGNLGDGGKIVCEPEPVDPVVSHPLLNYRTVYCDVCGKKCIGQSDLQKHLASARHTACIQCGQMFVCEVSKKHLKKCSMKQQ